MFERTPEGVNESVYVLWLLRNGRVTDWTTLANEFGFDPNFIGTLEGAMLGRLTALQEAGLVRLEHADEKDPWYRPPTKISLTPDWSKIQNALDISLTELTKLGPSAIIATPLFGRPRGNSTADVFVVMPFDPRLKPIYDQHIADAVRTLDLTVARGDDFFTAKSVMSDIWDAIGSARLVIADCTGRNPNVFYEVGLAHAVGKPVVLITQSSDDVPFDIRHLRYIQYEDSPRGMGIFEKKLIDAIRTELKMEAVVPEPRHSLFIVADSSDESHAALSESFHAVETALGERTLGRDFPWSQHYLPEVSAALATAERKPNLVHIVGHSGGPDAVMTGGDSPVAVDPAAMAATFATMAGSVEITILSACFSRKQAEAIAIHVPTVIGIPELIGDKAPVFAADFYKSLSAGRSVAESYEIATNQVRLQGIPDEHLPVLISNRTA